MSQIRVDYESARASASQLEQAAEQCASVARELTALGRQLPDCWTGEAAGTYLAALDRRITASRQLQEQAERLAASIRRAADEFERTEEKLTLTQVLEQSGGIGWATDVGKPRL